MSRLDQSEEGEGTERQHSPSGFSLLQRGLPAWIKYLRRGGVLCWGIPWHRRAPRTMAAALLGQELQACTELDPFQDKVFFWLLGGSGFT